MRTPLGEIPKDWLVFVEPHIRRPSISECWLWCGAMSHKERCTMRNPVTGAPVMVRQFVMRLFFDYPENRFVKASCGNPTCVNPNHLFIVVAKSWRKVAKKGLGYKDLSGVRTARSAKPPVPSSG